MCSAKFILTEKYKKDICVIFSVKFIFHTSYIAFVTRENMYGLSYKIYQYLLNIE